MYIKNKEILFLTNNIMDFISSSFIFYVITLFLVTDELRDL